MSSQGEGSVGQVVLIPQLIPLRFEHAPQHTSHHYINISVWYLGSGTGRAMYSDTRQMYVNMRMG